MPQKRIYMDHNATTPARPEVVEAMLPYFTKIFGNASGLYSFGIESKKALESSRETVADFLGAKPKEIIFTGSGTESDNLAIKGTAFANKSKGNHIITSSIEHAAVLNTCGYLEKNGFKVTYLPVDEYGIINPSDVKKAITKSTVLISIMYANNETGVIQPIREIGKIAAEKEVLFHTDAVQSVGKIPVHVNELNVDLLSMSGHKIYGPKGIGALYIKSGTRIEPIIHGGHHERNLRAGTENVALIAGLGKAVEIMKKQMEKEVKHIRGLRDNLWKKIKDKIEDVRLNGHPEFRVPNTLNVIFKYIESEAVIVDLDLKGIAVSGGSACSSKLSEPSHVLTAMGIDAASAQSTIRFSLGKDNTEKDIDDLMDVLPEIIKRLRKISPLYNKK
ncbi:MAG: cysteine desulfurase NifS [Endomicrobiales bacterium]|nr:cysteine desulfurase NifS [Endomicrobiales bacterium]